MGTYPGRPFDDKGSGVIRTPGMSPRGELYSHDGIYVHIELFFSSCVGGGGGSRHGVQCVQRANLGASGCVVLRALVVT